MNTTARTLAGCMAGLATLAGTALMTEAKTIRMTAAGASPPQVTPVQVTKEYFIPEVNRRIAATGKDFKIEWTEAYASTLAKFTEVLEATEEGIVDLGVQIHVFEESKLPLENVSLYVPFGTADVRKLTDIVRNARAKVPEMNQAWDRLNQVYLGSGSNDTIHMMTTFPLGRYEDLAGHKIGASGTMGSFLKNTGAVIVPSSMLDAYVAIKNGVYEGYTISWGLGFPYKVYRVAPYLTKVNFGAIAATGLSVNKDTWRKLPGWVQTIFRDVAKGWQERHAAVSGAKSKKFATLMQKQGAKIVDFPAEERRRWARQLPNIAKEWAARMDKRGLPGRGLLAAYMNGLRASGAEIVRHWDRE